MYLFNTLWQWQNVQPKAIAFDEGCYYLMMTTFDGTAANMNNFFNYTIQPVIGYIHLYNLLNLILSINFKGAKVG